MEAKQYSRLIDKELQNMPSYVFYYSQQPNLAVTTVYQYLTEFRRFFDWLREAPADVEHPDQGAISQAKSNREIELSTLEHLQAAQVQSFLKELSIRENKQSTRDSKKTINRTINALRSLFHYLTVTADLKDGEPYFYRNVMLKVPLVKGSKESIAYRNAKFSPMLYMGQKKHDWIDFLENQYENTLSNRARSSFKFNKERDIAIIALLLASGIRVSELTRLNLKDLNKRDRSILVVRKGNKKDAPLIADWAMPYINAYLEIRERRYQPQKSEQAFFLTRYAGQARRIASNTIERFVSKYSEAFPNGNRTTPHKLRHSLGTELYDETKDVMVVATQLGHTGISATDQYIQQTKVDQQRSELNKTD
ncbi:MULTISPECIES: tyrosine recombinase XerS [Lactobacillus]|uniref:Tyrosine recombinase XerS n=1 Tax=Lactobacillus xujianguonis TaxID=2495899 RepID=A0A437SUZ7_9LACO|nr:MULTISPECIES: tyrosine recombinase XerS [Lactobacillus]RVU70769.1 tyrosine recombinase XerS [Lactobacillus xujianguonis]RVU73968.1 tyrosine recombinase XerS [Lactobacillus xujianguonis]